MDLDIKSLRQCIYCHNFCKFSCPSFLAGKDQKIIQNQKNYLIYLSDKKKIEIDKDFGKSVYLCNDCRRCETYCIYSEKNVLTNNRYSKELIFKKGLAPEKIYEIEKNLKSTQNIFGIYNIDNMDAADKSKNNLNSGQYDVFIYSGDYVRFLEPGILKSFEKLLRYLNISYIYENNEVSDGLAALDFGMEEVFKTLAETNFKTINKYNFKKMIVLNPYSYYCFKEEYKNYGLDFKFEILQYVEFIEELVKENKIKISKTEDKIKYFDPCKLGRSSGIYEAPRNILRKLFGVDDINFFKNKEESGCCGGYISLFDKNFARSVSLKLLDEFNSFESKNKILLTACPLCLYNLKEADETKSLRIHDIVEYIGIHLDNGN